MRRDPDVLAKVKKINKIRAENSKELVANGDEALEPYIFDYFYFVTKFVVHRITICK